MVLLFIPPIFNFYYEHNSIIRVCVGVSNPFTSSIFVALIKYAKATLKFSYSLYIILRFSSLELFKRN